MNYREKLMFSAPWKFTLFFKSLLSTKNEIENFSQLKPDDLALLILLFQTLDKNIIEYDNILRDIRHISEYIAKFNKDKIFSSVY